MESRSGLIQKLVADISMNGPMPFARFMEMALYDPEYGYYMTSGGCLADEGKSRIGWQGDFFTAPELSPLLAETLVRQVVEIDAGLGHPPILQVIEMGAGNGTFARDFLKGCRRQAPGVAERLSYHIVERSARLRKKQRQAMESLMGDGLPSVRWSETVDTLPGDSVTGVFFSNELVDALPVHRVRGTPDGIREIYVDWDNETFVERERALSSQATVEYVKNHGIALEPGWTSELHVEADAWMAHVATALHRGMVITIDYGHSGNDYYSAARKDGTLLCYYRHSVSSDPYHRIGEQDMTAHVNFSALARTGKPHGLVPVGFTTLSHWLMGLGVDDLVRESDPESPAVQALARLLHPYGMGKTFKVLVQQKNMDLPTIAGLRYKAFFDDVL